MMSLSRGHPGKISYFRKFKIITISNISQHKKKRKKKLFPMIRQEQMDTLGIGKEERSKKLIMKNI